MPEYPDGPVVAVGAFVFKDGRVLLLRRGKQPGYGKWSIPGGSVEPDETLREAAAREVKEETGIDVEVGPVALVVEPVVRDADGLVQFHYIIVDFVARWIAGDPVADSDALEVRWFAPEEIDGLDATPGLAEAVRKAYEKIGPSP